AARQPWSACTRIARLYSRYASPRPAMLARWEAGEDVGPQGAPLAQDAWQARLWRLAAAELGHTPPQRRRQLLDRLHEAPFPGLPARVAVLAPRLDPGTAELLQAVASHHQVDLLALTPSPSRWRPSGPPVLARAEFRRPIGHPLNDSLAAVADETCLLLPEPDPRPEPAPAPASLLGWVQADLRADVPGPRRTLRPGDDSVQFHLSHGLDRQVEVLREVLASLFAGDPTLEPREVAVVTPDADAVAALVTANFDSGAAAHPARWFRVQLADRSVARANPLVGLLLDLLQLPDSRLEASTLLDLAGQPAVAARFGFTAENRERLVGLVERSGIRWGLSPAQRAQFGLDDFPQNTWYAGIQRMLLGVALSESGLVTAGTTLPLDDVDAADIDLIGGLTELVGRLQRMLAGFEEAATPVVWAQRCRSAVDALVRLGPAEQWQLADLWAGLTRFAAAGGDRTAAARPAVQRALAEQFGATPARGSFGNGSLLVCGPTSLRHVPHRVVVLLGFDAERFPRRGRTGGDDLLRDAPLVGDPDRSLADRQLLLDYVHAAREKLVVVARGRSEATGETVPLAAPLQELLDALDATAAGAAAGITRHHPLQPFDPDYFDPAVPGLDSVDPIAYRGARALLAPRVRLPEAATLADLAPWPLTCGVELDDLVAFYNHPARTLLRQRAGLTLSETRETTDEIPIELDHLERWQIGDRMLRRILAGDDPQAVSRAEWLRGSVPPFDLGQEVLGTVLDDVRAVQRQLPSWSQTAPVAHDLTLTVATEGHGPVALTGRVNSHDGLLLQVEFSSLQPRHRLATWLRLLAFTATGQGAGRARVIGKSRASTLVAPSPRQAAELLGRYLALYAIGMTRPLPALPRLCAQWAALRAAGQDPADPFVGGKQLARCWEWDADPNWKAFFSYPAVLTQPAAGVGLPEDAADETSLVGALAQLIWQPLLVAEGDR
ncbi:MAG: exodeoxyribonuclease V subunit gamma, partial [Propionicimonas sp.]|nr:exodeoxyribonuclease V subunit gamma [Propionicimonas sp.]